MRNRKIGSLPQAVQYAVFHRFAVDGKHGPLHAHKVSAPKFRLAAGAALLVLFVESSQEPDELLCEAVDSLSIRET